MSKKQVQILIFLFIAALIIGSHLNKNNSLPFFGRDGVQHESRSLSNKNESLQSKQQSQLPVQTKSPLQLLSWSCERASGFFLLQGEIKNLSSEALKDITVTGTFQTDNGDLVKTKNALIENNPTLPGQTSPFRVRVTDSPEIRQCGVSFKTSSDKVISYLYGASETQFLTQKQAVRGEDSPTPTPTLEQKAMKAERREVLGEGNPTPTPPPSRCYPNLPSPQLALLSIDQENKGKTYWLKVINWSSFPDNLFESAPHLPPCGLNRNASRTWLNIYDSSDKRIYGYCGFSSASDLSSFWFFRGSGASPPSRVYITLEDRQCNITYTSNSINQFLTQKQAVLGEGNPTPTASADDNQSDNGPDLVISSLSASLVGEKRITYSFTITNVGNKPANLDGPTDLDADNISVQAFMSKDTLFNNEGDLPAGGTILGLSPLGHLKPGDSRKGSFSASIRGDIRELPYLVLMVDWGKSLDESNEDNNLAIVRIGPQTEE